MKQNVLLHSFFLFCALLLLALAVATPRVSASTLVGQQSGDYVSHEVRDGDAAKSKQYWTSDRMKDASPIEQTYPRNGKDVRKQLDRLSSATPRATQVPPASYATFPYSVIGKVFFTDPQSGTDYVCSGTALQSANKSVVDTAGHCVMEGGSGNNFYTNWMFCPQRLEGNCPKGMWHAIRLYASTDWAQNNALGRDLGLAVVGKNNDKALTDVVGGVNIRTSISAQQQFTALGYPAAEPFDGEHMQQCSSQTIRRDTMQDPDAVGIACNMTGGSSGGGWLIRSGNTWYLNGHTSYGINFLPNVLFSPYYDNVVQNMYNDISVS